MSRRILPGPNSANANGPFAARMEGLVMDLRERVRSFRKKVEAAGKLILSGSLYGSLREIRKRVRREKGLLR